MRDISKDAYFAGYYSEFSNISGSILSKCLGRGYCVCTIPYTVLYHFIETLHTLCEFINHREDNTTVLFILFTCI